MKNRTTTAAAVTLLLASFGFLYRGVIAKLVHDWTTDDNYSHGVFIIPLALYFVWERRERLQTTARHPTSLGLLVVLASLGVLIAGTLGAELFLTRLSILGIVAGTLLFLAGWSHLGILTFPLLFLLLMIPLPAIIFNRIAFPLQLLASRVGEASLGVLDVPVLREGNLIVLASTTLEVAEACSGIRSLVSLLTLGIVYGYLIDARVGVRTAIALATVPIAIVANGLRVAGTGLAAHYYGPEAGEGFFHSFSGWLVFLVAFAMLFLVQRVIQVIAPARKPVVPSAASMNSVT